MTRTICLFVCFFTVTIIGIAADFPAGAPVSLAAQNPAGVPVRDQPTDNQYYRWPDKTEAVVIATQGNYVQVEASTKRGWVHNKYLVLLRLA